MKRGCPEHPKTTRLCRDLGIPRYAAVGILESTWHFTARFRPAGDVGRFSDQEIADAIGWQGDAGQLIDALVNAGYLDRYACCSTHRLLIHDWPEHADNAIKKLIARRLKKYGTGFAVPCGAIRPDMASQCLDADGRRADMDGPPEPKPEPEPLAPCQSQKPEPVAAARGKPQPDAIAVARSGSGSAAVQEGRRSVPQVPKHVQEMRAVVDLGLALRDRLGVPSAQRIIDERLSQTVKRQATSDCLDLCRNVAPVLIALGKADYALELTADCREGAERPVAVFKMRLREQGILPAKTEPMGRVKEVMSS